ncbi:MarR family transcriptional regulator [soil metagenome]
MSTPTFSTKLDDQLCFALYATSNAVTRFYRPHLKALGLTYPQYITMLALWEQDGLMVAALGARLGLDSGTMTPLLKRLESAGLVRRQRDDQDERRVVISLTPAGKTLQARAATVPETLACALDLNPPEVKQLVEALDGLRRNLSDAANDEE